MNRLTWTLGFAVVCLALLAAGSVFAQGLPEAPFGNGLGNAAGNVAGAPGSPLPTAGAGVTAVSGRATPRSGVVSPDSLPVPPTAYGIYHPYSPPRAVATVPGAGRTAASIPRKPFADWSPAPAYSPYLNLNRPNINGMADNYYNLVRPIVDQRALNQRQLATNRQYGLDLRNLQTTTQGQTRAMQRYEPMLDGLHQGFGGAPATSSLSTRFMNLGDYFPSAPQR